MADYLSSLPIINSNDTANGLDELQIKTKSGTILSVSVDDISKGLQTNDVKITMDGELVGLAAGSNLVGKIQLSDGTSDLTSTTVGSKVGLDVNVIGGVTLDVNLTKDNDSVLIYANTATDGSGTSLVPLVDADGNLQVDVLTISIDADIATIKASLDVMDDWDDGADRAKVNIQDISSIVGQQLKAASLPVVLASDQDTLDVNIVSEVASDRVHDYQATDDIAIDSSTTVTYTNNSGKIFFVEQIYCSASGMIKVEIKTGASGSTVTKAVAFNSPANLNADIRFDEPISVADSEVVEIVITNRDKDALPAYVFTNGYNK